MMLISEQPSDEGLPFYRKA